MKRIYSLFHIHIIAFLLVIGVMGAFPVGAPGFWQVQATSSNVIIAEVYNASSPSDEWIAIANIGGMTEELSGWSIQDYSGSGTPQGVWNFPEGVSIEPYSLLVVERSEGAANVPKESGVKTIVGGQFNIAAASDRVDLKDDKNKIVDGVAWGTYNETEGFRIREEAGQLSSFERISLTDTDSDADWLGISPAIAWEWAPLGEIELNGAPKPLVTKPADGENGAELGQELIVEFDKKIVKNFGTITIFNVSDHEMFASIPIEDAAVTIGGPDNSTLFISTESPFSPGKIYEATVPANAVVSESGVRNATLKWVFTTGVEKGSTPPPNGYRIEYLRHTDVAKGEVIGYDGAVQSHDTVHIYGTTDDEPLVTTTADENGAFHVEFDNPDKLISIIVSATASGFVESDPVEVDAKGFYTTSLNRIVDGDTIVLNNKILGSDRIRFLSIDTPETAQQYGDMATQILVNLIDKNEELIVELGSEPKDAYGRLLAHVYRKRDGLDLNKELIRLGAAVPYFIAPNLSHFEEYAAAAEEARDQGRGIWNPSDPLELMPYEWRFINDGRGGPDKYVADYFTKKLYEPEYYTEIEVQNRVFFFRNEVNDAQLLGFEWAGSGSSPFKELTGELVSILQAREQKQGSKVRVKGEVTAVFPQNAWIQDETAGIRLYGGSVAGLKVGDEIELSGTLKVYNGDLELTDFTFERLEGDTIPTPEPIVVNSIAEIGEDHYGRMIKLSGVWIRQDYLQADGGVVVTDGDNDLIVYAYAGDAIKNYLQSLFKGEKHKFDLVGPIMVFGQTKQLVPRHAGDIITHTSDIYPPKLLVQTPLQDAVNVSTTPEIALIFDESLIKGEGTIVVHDVLMASSFDEIDLESEYVSIAGVNNHHIIIKMPKPLVPGRMYDVEIPEGAFKDAAGNYTPRMTISFTTEKNVATGEIRGYIVAEARNDLSEVILIATSMDTGDTTTFSGLVHADGTFTISELQLPSGHYHLRAQLTHHIPVALENVEMTSGMVTEIGNLSSEANGGSAEGKMRAGDVVADGTIDIYDAAAVTQFTGQSTEHALSTADVNGDGIVDESDLYWVKKHFLPEILR